MSLHVGQLEANKKGMNEPEVGKCKNQRGFDKRML